MLGEAPLLAVRLSTNCGFPIVEGLRRVESEMTRRRFWCGLGVAALLMVGCTPDLVPGDAEAPLTASGTIRATEVRVASELGGRIQSVLVHEGDAVGTGEVIVTLDPTPWELELLPAEARASAARAELAVLEDGPRATEVEALRASVALAEADRDAAFAAWQNAVSALENPQVLDGQIVDARTQVALAEQAVELAEAELARVQLLRDQKMAGSVERRAADFQVVASEAALSAAEADRATAKALLSQLMGIRAKPLGYIAEAHAAEGRYRVAEAGVAVAQAQFSDLLAGPTASEVAIARAAVRQAEAEVDLLRLKVGKCALVSPIDGIVVAQVLQTGELAAPATTILKVADLSVVFLEVYVPENRVGLVQLRQAVRVSVDTYPGRAFEGQVSRIADEPEYTPRNVATTEERLNTFYAVQIHLANPDGMLKPGMPADAQF